jgi:hypothetical protein
VQDFISRSIPEITITTHPDTFIFSSSKATIELATYLYFIYKNKQLLVYAIGQDASSDLGTFRVNLFESDDYYAENVMLPPDPNETPIDLDDVSPAERAKTTVEKTMCLTAFLRYGIFSVYPWPLWLYMFSAILHPRIVFKNTHLFDRRLSSYQRGIFEYAAHKAGARHVVFC